MFQPTKLPFDEDMSVEDQATEKENRAGFKNTPKIKIDFASLNQQLQF